MSSIWDDISSWLGNLWGGTDAAVPAAPTILSATRIPASTASSLASSLPTDSYSDLWPALIQAGGGLAQTYYGLDAAKDRNQIIADQAAAAQKFEAEQNAKAQAAAAERAKIAAEAQIKATRIAHLADLYSAWGQINEKSGEAQGQSALQTGRNALEAIIAGSGRLR